MLHYTEAIGLDIGSHAAKAVHVRRRWGHVCIEKTAWLRLPSDPDERKQMLESFVSRNGWRGLPCVLAPPVDGVMLQSIPRQPDDPRPVAGIVDLELSQLSGLSETTTVRDCAVARDRDDPRILLAVGRSDAVEAAVELAEAGGLRPVEVTPQATALYNVVARRWRGKRGSRFIIVDIGHRRTSVIVGTPTALKDARHIPLGGSAFREGLQAIGSEEGENTTQELDRWIDALEACLAVCDGAIAEGDDQGQQGVVLTGGGARIEGVKERISARLGKPVFLLRELGRTSHVEDVERMALATGLALAGMGMGRIQLTLLPAETREAIILHSQAAYWMASGIALIAALLLLSADAVFQRHETKQALADARSTLNSIVASETKLARRHEENEQLEEQTRLFTTLVHNNDILRAVLSAASEAKHADDWFTRITDYASFFKGHETAPVASSPFDRVVIEGITTMSDLSTVRSMIDSLRNSPGILDADLLSDDALPVTSEEEDIWKRKGCTRFAVELLLSTP